MFFDFINEEKEFKCTFISTLALLPQSDMCYGEFSVTLFKLNVLSVD